MKVNRINMGEHGISGASYYAKDWLVLRDGGSDQWLYVCRLRPDYGLAYLFINIIDLPAYCGRDADARWAVSVSEVNLLDVSPETIVSALQSCGCDEALDFRSPLDRLRIAEMLFDHGSKAPLWDQSGGKVTFDNYGNRNEDYDENCPAFRRLRKEAREYAETLLDDDVQRNQQLNRVVNAIGQTAREYANGGTGLWKSLRRIKEQGDAASPQQQLVLGMYQKAETTLGLGPIPEDLKESSTTASNSQS